mmetsp:Transcript_24767/g.28338  ORF Transcript_24767/g.28338 Transcript_24767/m.28338 type:complete len:524 (-) Transcript_24767:53-1624(-)
MARITSAALTILLGLLQSSTLASAASTSIIDANGVFTRATIPDSSIGNNIVAVITSPDTPSFFDGDTGGVSLSSSDGSGASILSSPGATLTGTASLSKGNGVVAVSTVADSIILSGITESDLENGLDDTRHGHTLTAIFRTKIQDAILQEGDEGSEVQKTSLFLISPPCDIDEETILQDVMAIFETAKAESETDADFDDIFVINILTVENEEDAKKVMELASEAASTSSKSNILTSIANAYSKASSTNDASTSFTAAILACDDSFNRHHRTIRAKLSSWKSRSTRGLTVDNFGSAATQLMTRAMESYDRDTLSAVESSSSAASYRLEMRSKLQGRVEIAVRALFKVQVEILEKNTLKRFNNMLLRQHGKNNEGKESFYNDNAAAVRSAAFTFETAVEELEVPSLSLTKVKPLAEIDTKLNTALLEFPDSPAARLKNMREVTRAANKQKEPTERSLDFGLDLVAMIRPDGFGNLQGFAGYQLGGNNIIVGVHNDADSPDVISQFGGKRPPFIRVQPKLKVDVEL